MKKNGVLSILLAAHLSALMGVFFYLARGREPNLSASVVTTIRVLTNYLPILPFWLRREKSVSSADFLLGKRRGLLSLWGFFGALTVLSYFASMHRVGIGQSSILYSTNGAFIILLSPFLGGQRNRLPQWLACGGALLGLMLIKSATQSGATEALGTTLGIASAIFAALAFLMVSKVGKSERTATVLFYWCLCCTAACLLMLVLVKPLWPTDPLVWILLLLGGLSASLSQHFTAEAFQKGAPALIGGIAYLAPVLSMACDLFIFHLPMSAQTLTGAFIILMCGVAIPLLTSARSAPLKTAVS